MMKLSTMKKVVETVDEDWHSPLAEQILENWGYDKGTVYYFRASANFLFVFQKEGEYYFLRFSDAQEKDLSSIELEIDIINYLYNQSLNISLPIKSRNNKYIESVNTELGCYYAVVFKALEGQHLEIENLEPNQFYLWGKNLGKLHKAFKEMPLPLSKSRGNWKEQLLFAKDYLPDDEVAAKFELESIINWSDSLEIKEKDIGLIHYDFELDNLRWNQDEIGMLDFDDCINHLYVADIAFALRDLFHKQVDLNNESFIHFLEGYTSLTDIDSDLIKELPWFLRMHRLMTFIKLLKSIDIAETNEYGEWLINLRKKLSSYIVDYRQVFESNLHNSN